MSSAIKGLSDYNGDGIPSSEKMTFGVIVSEYNTNITFRLLEGCLAALTKHGAKDQNIRVVYVPGAFELTLGAQMLNESIDPDALICLGCVIKGDTDHDIYINHAVAQGITRLSLQIQKPVVFGLLTPNTMLQAMDRAGGEHGNKGVECAIAAIKMVALKNSL